MVDKLLLHLSSDLGAFTELWDWMDRFVFVHLDQPGAESKNTLSVSLRRLYVVQVTSDDFFFCFPFELLPS